MCSGVLRLPEEDYTYSQQLGLEFVKSQYGAVVLGVFGLSIFGVTLAGLLAPLLAQLYENVSDAAEEEVRKLPSFQQFLILAMPVLWVPVLLPKYGRSEVLPKIAELNLGNRLFSFFNVGGTFGL